MANLLSWLGGVANGIGGQINRTANQVQRNVVNPAVNFGVRNVQQAQRNVAQLPANVQRGAFDLQQQANNARRAAEEEARRIAEQRTRDIMSIGNQAQQGFRQTTSQAVRAVPQIATGITKQINPVIGNAIDYSVKNFDRPMPVINVSPRQVSAQIPQATQQTVGGIGTGAKAVGGAVLYGPIQTANVINYPITEMQARTELEKGNIKYDTYKQIVDEAMAKAGINPQDEGWTLARKTSAPIAMTALDVLTAGALPGKWKAISTPMGVAQNAKAGAGLGAVYGGLNVAGQKEQITPMDVVTNVVGGTATGGVLGGGSSALIKGGQKALGYDALNAINKQIDTQNFIQTMNKVTPQTAPDLPTKGKMISQGYQDVSVDFKPKPVTNDFTGKILDDANYKLRNGQISEKQYKAFIVDDYTKRTGKLPTDDEVQGFVNVAKEKPYAKLEQLREQYSKPIADTVPQVGKTDPLIAEARKYKSADEFVKAQGEPVYHGSINAKEVNKSGFSLSNQGKGSGSQGMYGNGVYLTNASDRAKLYGDVVDTVTDKNMKFYEPTIDEYQKTMFGRDTNYGDPALITKKFKEMGYDGIKLTAKDGEQEIVVFDPSKVKTKAQLTDLYNQATKGIESKGKPIYELAPKSKSQLHQEATKYKNAKEFQDSLKINYEENWNGPKDKNADRLMKTFKGRAFHGTDAIENIKSQGFRKGEYYNSGIYFSDTPERAIDYMAQARSGTGNKTPGVITTKLNNLKIKNITYDQFHGINKGFEGEDFVDSLKRQGFDGIKADGETLVWNPQKIKNIQTLADIYHEATAKPIPKNRTIYEMAPKPKEAPVGKQVLPKGINKEDVVEVRQFGSTTKGMVGNDTDIAIFLDPKHPSFAKIGSEYNRKVGKTEYHVFPDNDEGHAVFNAMLDYKDPKYGTGKGIAVKLNKDATFSTDSVKNDRFGVPFKEESVPVAKLIRNQEYQPRIGQSGEATTANVFKKGYQEGLSDQPMLVRKEGNKYTVLGGHSRTMGIEQRAEAGLNNPANIKARVYEDITDAQARQISRGANQGAQYENTLDMAKSISASISENKAPSVQKQNMVKGFGHDDYKYLWDVVKDNNILKEKVNAGGISAEETLAIARQGRVKGLEPEKVAGVIQGLDKAGKLTRQNAKNVINLLSGKIKAGQMRTNQIGMFGDVEKAVKAVDLLDEYQKVSAELVKKRNALAIATDTLDKKSPAYKELRLKVKEYGQKLKTVETEVVNQYNAKISKNVPEIPSKTPPPPKPPTKKVRMNEYGELQVKERGFVTTVKNSPQTTPEVAKGVKGKYEPINNIDTLDTARKEVGLGKSGRVNNKKAYEEAIDTAKRSEDYSTETQAQSLILIEHLQSKGRTQDAIDIVEKMSERATKNGQASQILAAYNRLKPEGVLMMAQREIDKAKAMNPTKYADLKIEKVQATKLRKMATELQGLTGDERIVAQKEMLDEIGRLVPTPNMTKAVTLWKAGLLTGIKGGVSGNAVGNASNILVKKIADAPASAIDTVITQFTGNRSKVFTLKGWLSGFGEGLKDGKKQIQLGTGADDLASKLDYKKVYFSKNNPAGRFAQKYTDFVFGFYSASDKPWKMAALKNSLTDLATVEAKNKGLKGAAKAKFIKETVEAPPDNLLVQATNDSLDATFQDATALGGMLSGAKRSLAKHGPVAGAVGEVVAPFTGIPSSVATKMYRYSLVSSAVDIVRAIKASNKGQFDQAAQRKVSESIGKGLTGTALLGTGYALWNAGLMTTGMPQDPKERDLWELEGKQPWSVKVGGEWLSLNYTGPVLAILGAGATAAQSIKEGNTLPQTAFIAGMGTAKAVLESSPLKGVQSTLDVISDPARNGPRYLESLAGSTIPTISADVASSIDPLQREAMSPLDAITNRVPIWRYGLNPKVDPFGEPKANQAYGPQAIVDPFRMSEDRTTSLSTELRNLYNTNKDLGTMPSDFKKDFYGGDTKLNEKQIYDLTVKIKPEIKQAWEQIIADPRYQNLSPEQRKKVLDKAAKDIRAARKFETGVQGGFLNEGEARKKLEAGSKRILRGGQTDYINKETGGQDTPKQKYETALNDYEDKKKNGEISSIDEIKAQKALKKLQAQSEFDQDTVDLYGLSLKEIDGYLKSQPNGGGILEKLLALDDAMEASGSTRKFKNRKLYVATKSKSGGKKGRKGRKASTRKGTAIKIPSIKGSTYKAPKFVTRKIASRKLSVKSLPKIKSGKVYV